ncbi:MAG: metal ABC transporter permease [Cytophagales bacterium]
MINNDITTILIAFLAAVNCGLLGSFMVLRKRAMFGDAIAHAILPGIVVMFLVTRSMNPFFFWLGALVSGVAVTLLIGFLDHNAMITKGAAIELGASFFFALGVLLISVYAKAVDLDPSCVWHSNLETACFDVWRWRGLAIPKALLFLGGTLVVNLVFVGLCYRALFLISFDNLFARSLGITVRLWDYGFMLLVTFNIVICFRIINAPLVVGFLTMPPAIAWLVTDRMSYLLGYTLMVSAILAMNGYWIAKATGLSLTGMMMVVGGVLFLGLSLLVRCKASVTPGRKNA